MKIETLNRERAKEEMSDWNANGHELKNVSTDYERIRREFALKYTKIEQNCEDKPRKDYIIDIHFGVYLYQFLNSESWFNVRLAADDGFWRYLSVVVVPDIVAKRWGYDNENHFWKQSNRIWLKTLWWYLHLTWNQNPEETLRIISGFSFNTDMIQGLVERAGHKGTFINVFRSIVKHYSEVDRNIIIEFKKRVTSKNDSLFRAIMRLNTARCLVVDPCLCKGGEDGYVKSLFKDLNINIK